MVVQLGVVPVYIDSFLDQTSMVDDVLFFFPPFSIIGTIAPNCAHLINNFYLAVYLAYPNPPISEPTAEYPSLADLKILLSASWSPVPMYVLDLQPMRLD